MRDRQAVITYKFQCGACFYSREVFDRASQSGPCPNCGVARRVEVKAQPALSEARKP